MSSGILLRRCFQNNSLYRSMSGQYMLIRTIYYVGLKNRMMHGSQFFITREKFMNQLVYVQKVHFFFFFFCQVNLNCKKPVLCSDNFTNMNLSNPIPCRFQGLVLCSIWTLVGHSSLTNRSMQLQTVVQIWRYVLFLYSELYCFLWNNSPVASCTW